MASLEQGKKRASVSDWISLIRPPNSLMVGFAVVVGIVVSSSAGTQISNIVSFRALLGFLTGFSISSFSMVTNDIYDYEVDKINQPDRPLSSGRVSLSRASYYSVPFLIIGLITGFFLGPYNLAIAGIFALIGWYYNYHGKKLGLGGNCLVALSLAIPYIYGSVAIGNFSINLAYLLALTSFLAGLGREVLKGISDIPGDRIRNIRSIATDHGVSVAKQLSSFLFILAVFSSSLPVVAGVLGKGFLVYVILVLVTDGIFCYLALMVMRLKIDAESVRLKKIALAGMMLGLLAYLLAGLAA